MKILLIMLFLAASALIGCQQPDIPTLNADYPPIKPPTRIDVIYQCDQGVGAIEMRFFPDHGVAVLVLNQQTHELQQQISASGTWYSNAIYNFRSKGNQAWLEIGRRAPIECKAQN